MRKYVLTIWIYDRISRDYMPIEKAYSTRKEAEAEYKILHLNEDRPAVLIDRFESGHWFSVRGKSLEWFMR